jgi:hypothetical protein
VHIWETGDRCKDAMPLLCLDSTVSGNIYHGNGTKLLAYSAQTRLKAMDTVVTRNNLKAHVRYP